MMIDDKTAADVSDMLDQIAAAEAVQSNCMFQLALMLARIAVEPGAGSYKDETAQALMGLLRKKPKSNVLRLFGAVPERVHAEQVRVANA